MRWSVVHKPTAAYLISNPHTYVGMLTMCGIHSIDWPMKVDHPYENDAIALKANARLDITCDKCVFSPLKELDA